MKPALRIYQSEDDYWRIRNFLREIFLLNNCQEQSWHVARLDYWRWHFILNCHVCDTVEGATSLWETENGEITAVLNSLGRGEIRLHVHQYSVCARMHVAHHAQIAAPRQSPGEASKILATHLAVFGQGAGNTRQIRSSADGRRAAPADRRGHGRARR